MMDHLHLIYSAMAFNATYSSIYMNSVIEVNIVRCLVYPDPWDSWSLCQGTISVGVLTIGKLSVFIQVFAVVRLTNGE
jgi:NADH:ubiquinone oxidoreductase subunit H